MPLNNICSIAKMLISLGLRSDVFLAKDIMSDTKKPIARVALHPVSAAIWRNEGNNGDALYNVTFERRYRDDSGKWASTASFGFIDLLVLAKVADMAYTQIYRLRTNNRQVEPVDP
jgi:hypothetical protein